jgi:hypothetical protein
MLKKLLVAFTLSAAAVTSAQAQLVAGSPTCDLSITNPLYNQCWGSFDGNNIGNATDRTNVLNLLNGQGLGTFVETGTTNSGLVQGPFQQFTGAGSGSLFFLNPQSSPFVLALKAGNRFSLFYFAPASAITQVDYTTNGIDVNGRNAVPAGLSHATLYNTAGGLLITPEPSTYLLMAAGLGLVAVAARRRRTT